MFDDATPLLSLFISSSAHRLRGVRAWIATCGGPRWHHSFCISVWLRLSLSALGELLTGLCEREEATQEARATDTEDDDSDKEVRIRYPRDAAFDGHFNVTVVPQTDAIDTVAVACLTLPVVEDMTEVSSTTLAMHLNA